MALTPSRLRDRINNEMTNPKPGTRVLVRWIKGYREVTDFHFDDDGNMVLEFLDHKEEK